MSENAASRKASDNAPTTTTPEYVLRSNRTYIKFNRLCAEWVKRHRPEVAEKLRRQAKKEEVK
jgi:hypothetical protein